MKTRLFSKRFSECPAPVLEALPVLLLWDAQALVSALLPGVTLVNVSGVGSALPGKGK